MERNCLKGCFCSKEGVVNKDNCHSKLDLESSTQVVYEQQQQASKILDQVQDDSIIRTTKAFTLIELLVVVLIIGILAAVAVPQYQMAVAKSRYATLKHIADSIAKAQEVYYLSNNTYADSFDKLDVDMPGGYTDLSEKKNYPCYSYDWGTCFLSDENSNVVCKYNMLKMQYQIKLQHSSTSPGIRRCVVIPPPDTNNDIRVKICQGETNTTDPTNPQSKTSHMWTY